MVIWASGSHSSRPPFLINDYRPLIISYIYNSNCYFYAFYLLSCSVKEKYYGYEGHRFIPTQDKGFCDEHEHLLYVWLSLIYDMYK